jgi:histone chaperone ASF1
MEDLEWKVIYVGSAEDANADQVLEEVMVGPVPVGINKFVLQAVAPDHTAIPKDDLIGVTVVLVTCSFMDQEFIRIGYYVNNELADYDPENPPAEIDIAKLYRSICADQPRVTRFAIDWTGRGVDVLEPALTGEEALIDENDENEDMAVAEDEEEDEEDEEDGDENAEVDLEAEDDEEEGDEDDEEAEEGGDDMAVEMVNEDSMDVLQMQQAAVVNKFF